MSAQSFRSRRLEIRGQTLRRGGTLNLVSLMDIFTILVFFLLVNASDVEVLPSPRAMELPESVSEQRAREAPVIMITRDEILLQAGNEMASIVELSALTNDNGTVISALRTALEERIGLLPVEGDDSGLLSRGELNIMADKDTPYATLKRVMTTATGARFADISLTVLQKVPEENGV